MMMPSSARTLLDDLARKLMSVKVIPPSIGNIPDVLPSVINGFSAGYSL